QSLLGRSRRRFHFAERATTDVAVARQDRATDPRPQACPVKRLRTLSACLLLITSFSQAAVTVSGDVANPGPVELPAGGRLLDVISVAVPNAEGYWLAGVLLRQSLLEEQARLKAGVLFDLDVLQRMASLFDKPGRAALALRLSEQVRQMPVTGRQIANLDPVA